MEQNTFHSNLFVRPKEFLHVCMSTKILPRGKMDFFLQNKSVRKDIDILLVTDGF